MDTNVPTTHTVVITVDPASSLDVVTTPEGLILHTGADPEKVGPIWRPVSKRY